MITVVRTARVLLILLLAFITLLLVVGVGTPDTGPVEKVVLLGLIGACIYAAAKVSKLADRAVEYLARH